MIITHKLEMDLVRRGAMPKLDVVQGDSNTRVLELTLYADGEAWTVPDTVSIRMRYSKSDGTKGIYDTLPNGAKAWSAAENVVTMILAPQMLTAEGAVLAQLELLQGQFVLATFTIQINAEQNPADGMLESEDYVNMLQWMEGELNHLLTQAKESGEFDGPQGEQGVPGEAGPSAYEFAVAAGYTGTEEEFGQMLITQYLPLTGGTMSGTIAMSSRKITGLGTPTNSADAVTKKYVDDKRKQYTATLSASGWSSTAPYTQTVYVSGLLSTDMPHIGPVYSGDADADIIMQAAAALISYATAETGKLIFTCLEGKPSVDVSIQMEVLR